MYTEVFSDASKMYFRMIRDIAAARHRVYLEVYILAPDLYGRMIRNALTDAAKRGVEVKVLLDAWGTDIDAGFFSDFTKSGGQLRFFKRFYLSPAVIRHHHRRNHRKLLVIDDSIFYIGSANISEKEASWCQFSARIEDSCVELSNAFLDSFRLYNRLFHSARKRIVPIRKKYYTILRDVPSFRHRVIRDQFLRMIRSARRKIFIETPYFIPDHHITRAMYRAARRGVHVCLIIPKRSDVRPVDFLAEEYLGRFHRAGVHIFLKTGAVLHAKCILADDRVMFGTANLDYRSTIHQYEMMLVTGHRFIVHQIIEHIEQSLLGSEPFDYVKWERRPSYNKSLGKILRPFRQLI